MGLKRTIARNVFSNWVGLVVNMIAGFFLVRFLIDHLGENTYGFWVIIGSVAGYFGLFDVGIRGSVGRYLAYYWGKEDHEGASRSLSTGFTLLCLAGLVVLVAVIIVLPFFGSFFHIPEAELQSAQIALFLSGLTFALFLPMSLFDGTLWALERFDLINIVDILFVALRFGTTILFVRLGYDLVALATITMVTLLLGTTCKYVLTRRLAPHLHIRLRMRPENLKELFSFGIWNFISSVTGKILTNTSIVIIGRFLGSFFVTLFTPVAQLNLYAIALSRGMTGVFTPLLTGLHARSEKERQKSMFLGGSRLCVLFGLFFLTGTVALGKDLIIIWLRKPHFNASYPVLCVLAAGAFFEMIIGMAPPILLSMARNRYLALLNLIQLAGSIGLTLILIRPLGVLGIGLALAASKFVIFGVLLPRYICRTLDIRLRDYVGRTVLPTAAWALPGMMIGYALWGYPTRHPVLWLVKAALLGVPFAFAFWFGGLTPDHRRTAWELIRKRLTFPDVSEGQEDQETR